jgi:hypothetical protein
MAVIYNEALGLYIFDDTENNVFAMPDTGNANVLGNALANEIGGNDGNNILDGGAGGG